MENKTKNEKWNISCGKDGKMTVWSETELFILPEVSKKDYHDVYEYVVKLHNDRLRFKQKQRAKKNRKDGYVKTNPIKESYIDGNEKWIVNGISLVPNTNRKTCRYCKTCKDGCEFYDKGICRGIVYSTNPPQYDKCEFDK